MRRPTLRDGAILLAIWGLALALRTLFSYDQVFLSSFVNFQDPDSWYHMRLIDALVANFPHRVTVDPYVVPGGAYIPIGPFFDYLVAAVALVLGLGSPTPGLVDAVAAILPAVLGATVVVPVYWIGRLAFGRVAALLAAALIAIMPGPFLSRTRLGSTDHHVAEVLLSATTVLFLMGAMASTSDDSAVARKRSWGLILLAGVAWGAYLLAWTSGVLLSLIVCAWAILQILLDAAHERSGPAVARVVVPSALMAAGVLAVFETMSAPRYGTRLLSVLATAGVVLALEALRRVTLRAGARPTVLAAGTASMVAAGAVLVAFLAPGAVAALRAAADQLTPSVSARSVAEVLPLFYAADPSTFSLLSPWYVFRSTFFLAVVALVPLGWLVVRQGRPALTLVFVYSLAMLVATVAQFRFGYYLAVNLALLSGWASAAFIRWAEAQATQAVATVRAKDRQAALARATRLRRGVAAAAVLLVVFVPTALLALSHVRQETGMPIAWHGALEWMRGHTPEPFATPSDYAAPRLDAGNASNPAYTVMNWWETGYWIVRGAQRVPSANPTQTGAEDAARFLMATDPQDAARRLADARSRYVVLSDDLVYLPFGEFALSGKLRSVAEWVGQSGSSLAESFYQPGGGGPPVTLFYPDYYRSMAARLLLFGGRPAQPEGIYVITWVQERRPDGAPYKAITVFRRFENYAEAETHLASLGPGNHAIVGRDPLKSCVPLEALDEYRLVYESPDGPERPTGMGSVRVFEYVPLADTRQPTAED